MSLILVAGFVGACLVGACSVALVLQRNPRRTRRKSAALQRWFSGYRVPHTAEAERIVEAQLRRIERASLLGGAAGAAWGMGAILMWPKGCSGLALNPVVLFWFPGHLLGLVCGGALGTRAPAGQVRVASLERRSTAAYEPAWLRATTAVALVSVPVLAFLALTNDDATLRDMWLVAIALTAPTVIAVGRLASWRIVAKPPALDRDASAVDDAMREHAVRLVLGASTGFAVLVVNALFFEATVVGRACLVPNEGLYAIEAALLIFGETLPFALRLDGGWPDWYRSLIVGRAGAAVRS